MNLDDGLKWCVDNVVTWPKKSVLGGVIANPVPPCWYWFADGDEIKMRTSQLITPSFEITEGVWINAKFPTPAPIVLTPPQMSFVLARLVRELHVWPNVIYDNLPLFTGWAWTDKLSANGVTIVRVDGESVVNPVVIIKEEDWLMAKFPRSTIPVPPPFDPSLDSGAVVVDSAPLGGCTGEMMDMINRQPKPTSVSFDPLSLSGDSVDMVNHPPHYQLLPGVEVIDVREAILKNIPEGTDYNTIDHWSRAWEYLTRMFQKNGLEDAKKAKWYLERMIEKMEG